MEEDLLVVL
jgi:hypothetical protein